MSPWSGKSAEEFEKDRELFEGFLDVVPDALLGVDDAGKIIFANAQTETLFRAKRGELIGLQVEALIPQRFRGGHGARREGYFAAPRIRPASENLGLSARRLDGEEFPAEISLSSFRIGDRTIAAAAIRDISSRENPASSEVLEMNQARRLESVGALAGGIAHDFNNLLGIIINYAQLAADAIDDDAIKDDIRQIQDSALRAADLTRQLLVFSRREVLATVPVSINELVGDLEKLLRRTLGEQVELRTELAVDLWSVIADAGQLEQVIVNLAVNARDAMPSGGILEIATSNVELEAEYVRLHPGILKPGRYVRISVSDSGVGMEPDVLERAFEPFFTTKDRSQGTGLGLATVYGIVKQSGGEVFVFSKPGSGTAVSVYLPASDAALIDRIDDDAMPRVVGRGETILVVEDQEAVRRLVERMLRESGYEVVGSPNTSAALRLLEEPEGSGIDMLLTDVVMPGMQGDDFARRAAKTRPDLKILLMSGYSQAIIARIDGQAADFDLIEKPFTRTQLLRAVMSALAKSTMS